MPHHGLPDRKLKIIRKIIQKILRDCPGNRIRFPGQFYIIVWGLVRVVLK